MPLDVRGLESQQFVVDPEIEVADRAALVVRLQHLLAEYQAPWSAVDHHSLFLSGLAHGRESRHPQVVGEADGFENLVVERDREVPGQEESGGSESQLRVGLQQPGDLARESSLDIMLPQVRQTQIVLAPRRKFRYSGDFPDAIVFEISKRVLNEPTAYFAPRRRNMGSPDELDLFGYP